MELFYSKAACSMAPHIALIEAGAQYKLTPVSLADGMQKKPEFLAVNPKGTVPALKTDKGDVLTEVALLLQYIADQAPEKNLIPKAGSMERYRAQEWLNYVSSEFHKGLGAFFGYSRLPNEQTKKDMIEFGKTRMKWHFDLIAKHFDKNNFLMGSQFSVVDAYLFTVLNWCSMVQVDLTPWPSIMSFMERMKMRPAVQTAMKEEGLI